MTFSHEKIDGLSIRVRRQERPGAPTLLMTNAWPLSIRCWDSNWDAWSGFNLLAYDMPGFGLSEGGTSHMSPSGQAAFAVKVMDHFQIARAHALGPDVGVPALLWLAVHQPARLESLMIFNGPGTAQPDLSWELTAISTSRVFRNALGLFGPVFASEAIRRGYRRFKPTADARKEYRRINAASGRGFRDTLEYLAHYPSELPTIDAKLGSLKLPVLILWGDEDPFVKVSNAYKLRERIPGSELQILKGCGHFSHEDAGDEFSRIVQDWCMRHAPRQSAQGVGRA